MVELLVLVELFVGAGGISGGGGIAGAGGIAGRFVDRGDIGEGSYWSIPYTSESNWQLIVAKRLVMCILIQLMQLHKQLNSTIKSQAS